MQTKKINIKNQVHYYYENLIDPKKIETKMFLSISKAIKTLKVTYFARYKIYLVVDYYTLDKVLSKIKKISTEKLDDTRILIDTDDKLPHDITFKNAVKLRT